MASASCSSTCIPRRELFCCPHVLHREKSQLNFGTRANDIATSHPSFRNHLCAPRIELLFYGKTAHRISIVKEKRLGYAWKDYIKIPRKSIFKEWFLEKHYTHLIKAVATVEPKCLVPCENSHRCDSNLQFDSNSESQMFHSPNDDSLELDERERLRRMKISKANKGSVPWNKGRKHSAETLQRIRERTKIAMQDPKVKMKLVNLGHAQSEETRIKIGVGVREGWQRRREMLMVQESCLFDWQNMVAEASRKGYASEDELQWDSYKILDEQLKKEWLESVEKRKTMPRLKGSKRAPKSPEQRRKISESISAKWADPEYRDRVFAALAKYHGVPVGAGRKARRKPASETPSVKRESVKKKPTQLMGINDEPKSIKKSTSRRKRNATPSYKDPMASSKLEMIKKIRAERTAMETRKREATERAKLLIAEAEKAAKALEVAALKSPLAQASLLETRKLIAEATRSIESIESGQLTSQDTGDEASSNSGRAVNNNFQTTAEIPNTDTYIDELQVNGSHLLTTNESSYRDFDIDRLTLQNALKAGESLPSTRNTEDTGVIHGYPSASLQPNNVIEEDSDFQVGRSKINGSIRYKSPPPEREESETKESNSERSTICATKTKKWVRGRLVEVEEDKK